MLIIASCLLISTASLSYAGLWTDIAVAASIVGAVALSRRFTPLPHLAVYNLALFRN